MKYIEPVMFEIPVTPTVLKYLRVYTRNEPILLDPALVPFGQYLWTLAQCEKTTILLRHSGRTNADNKLERIRHYVDERFSERIGVGACTFHDSRKKQLLNNRETEMFDNYVVFHLRNAFLTGADARSAAVSINAYIRQFCDRYDLADEDYSEATLRQLYTRYRSAKALPRPASFSCTGLVAADNRITA